MQLWAPAGRGGQDGVLAPPPQLGIQIYATPPPAYKDNLTRKKLKRCQGDPIW